MSHDIVAISGTDKFWIAIWIIIGMVTLILGLSIPIYYNKQNQIIQAMVEAGANPIEASCAISTGRQAGKVMCTAFFMNRP